MRKLLFIVCFIYSLGGGFNNVASANQSAIAGGFDNQSSAANTFIGGGTGHRISAAFGVIGGGESNRVTGQLNAILGGVNNDDNGLAGVMIAGNSITAINPDTLHINGLWANNIPGPGFGTCPTGTIYWDAPGSAGRALYIVP